MAAPSLLPLLGLTSLERAAREIDPSNAQAVLLAVKSEYAKSVASN